MNPKRLSIIFIIIIVSLLVASLTQKCYCHGSDCGDSLIVFLLGWLGILMELGDVLSFVLNKIQGKDAIFNFKIGATFCWLANPLLLISFVSLRMSPKATIIISGLSTLIILSFLLFNNILENEAGYYGQITSYGTGYFLWLASSVTLLVGSIYLKFKQVDDII